MNETQLQRYLYEHIPLSQAMAVEVESASITGVVLSAPLAPNINHRETLFGGSASAISILAAWALLFVRMDAERLDARLVIQRNTMDYLIPVAGPVRARCMAPADQAWARYLRVLRLRGKARISLVSQLEYRGQPAAYMHGDFVALKTQ